MDFICCVPTCPPLLSNGFIYSSDDNLYYQRSNLIFEKKLSSYAEQFSRRFSLSYYQKSFDEEFESISSIDNQDVSFSLNRIFLMNLFSYKLFAYFRLLMENLLIK